jgi:hypothetical protein
MEGRGEKHGKSKKEPNNRIKNKEGYKIVFNS